MKPPEEPDGQMTNTGLDRKTEALYFPRKELTKAIV